MVRSAAFRLGPPSVISLKSDRAPLVRTLRKRGGGAGVMADSAPRLTGEAERMPFGAGASDIWESSDIVV